MKWLAPGLVLLALLAGCRDGDAPQPEPGSPLDADELAAAVAAAKSVLTTDAEVTSATYRVHEGAPPLTNTGHPCHSRRLVRIRLIGTFPNVATTGHPVRPWQPVPDFTVAGMRLVVDAGSDEPCQISVQTLENGPLRTGKGAWTLYEP